MYLTSYTLGFLVHSLLGLLIFFMFFRFLERTCHLEMTSRVTTCERGTRALLLTWRYASSTLSTFRACNLYTPRGNPGQRVSCTNGILSDTFHISNIIGWFNEVTMQAPKRSCATQVVEVSTSRVTQSYISFPCLEQFYNYFCVTFQTSWRMHRLLLFPNDFWI